MLNAATSRFMGHICIFDTWILPALSGLAVLQAFGQSPELLTPMVVYTALPPRRRVSAPMRDAICTHARDKFTPCAAHGSCVSSGAGQHVRKQGQ